jgi:hypothetical protein
MNFKKISSLLYISGISALLLTACDPDTFEPEGIGSFSVTNAAPGSPTVDVLVDGQVTSTARLTYGTTTITQSGSAQVYLPILAGAHNINISVDTGKTSLTQISHQAETGKIHSFFLYDSIVNNSAPKVLKLTDDLTLPTGANGHVRFLNLAPNSGPLDVTLVRGTVYDSIVTASPQTTARVFVPADSITLSNRAFIGPNPDANALAMFTPFNGSTGAAIAVATGFSAVPAANRSNRYQIKVKTAGTQTVRASITTATTTLTSGRIFTIYTSGTARNQPLGVFLIANY